MSKQAHITGFNKYLKEFCQKLNVMIPENEHITLVNNVYDSGLLLDNRAYIRNFYKHVNEYHQDILNQNEKVFLNKNLNFLPYSNEIDEFKVIWTKLSKDYQLVIWNYLKVLSTLAGKVYDQ
jgi:hypothetical protein